jgi:hypothetical protein
VYVSDGVFDCWMDRCVEAGRGFRWNSVSASVWWCFVSLCYRWVPWCQPCMAAGECLYAALGIAADVRVQTVCCLAVVPLSLPLRPLSPLLSSGIWRRVVWKLPSFRLNLWPFITVIRVGKYEYKDGVVQVHGMKAYVQKRNSSTHSYLGTRCGPVVSITLRSLYPQRKYLPVPFE